MEERRRISYRFSSGVIVFLAIFSEFTLIIHGEDGPMAQALFVFGDSLLDVGNNNYIPSIARANYVPFGIDFGFPTGRFCNGLTVADYAALELGLPLVPPYLDPSSRGGTILRGLNYASAASGILEETGQHYAARIPFNRQIDLFETNTRVELNSMLGSAGQTLEEYLGRSIFMVNFGSNDYINNYLLPHLYASSRNYSPSAFADLLIQLFSEQLKRLYKLGARKVILPNLGPLGCIPNQLSMTNIGNTGCIDEVNEMVVMFNDRLRELSTAMSQTLVGSTFVYQDVYNVFMDMINNPFAYGFRVVNQACCGIGKNKGTLTCLPLLPPCSNRNQYIFWDAFHPTQAANAIVADLCYKKTTNCQNIHLKDLAKL